LRASIIQAVLLFIAFVVFTHILPAYATIFLLLTALFFIGTKKGYIWLAVVLMLYSCPGGLFAVKPLSIGVIPGLGELHYLFLFVIIGHLKYIHKPGNLFIKTNVYYVVLYIIFIIIIFGLPSYTNLIRVVIAWSTMFLIPKMLSEESERKNFFAILFIFSLIVLLMNIYESAFKIPFATLLGEVTAGSSWRLEKEEYARPVFGSWVAIVSMVGALKYSLDRKSPFNVIYLYTIILLAILTILLSATRGWTASIFVILIFYLFTSSRDFINTTLLRGLMVLLLFVLISQVPIIKTQLNMSFERLLTSKSLVKGDLSEEATGGRIQAGHKVMEKFSESPLIGLGYGPESQENYNVHAGNQTMLMRYGIIGYGFFLLLWITYIRKLYSRTNSLKYQLEYRDQNKMNIAFFLAIFLIHSTSGTRLDLMANQSDAVWVSLVFALASIDYNNNNKFLKYIRRQPAKEIPQTGS